MQEHGTNRAPLYQLYAYIGLLYIPLNLCGVYGLWKMGKIEQKRENDDDICPAPGMLWRKHIQCTSAWKPASIRVYNMTKQGIYKYKCYRKKQKGRKTRP